MSNYIIKKIILFTLNACPIGRSMMTVLDEVSVLFPQLEFERVSVEVHIEEANHYRIKTNPTIIFADEKDKELYRLEGFHETNIVKDIIKKINLNEITGAQELEENTETEEKYTIYLIKDRELSPVDVIYNNKTSIKAPRITAINLLLQADKDGYKNPFPPGTTLELVQFQNTYGAITLKFITDVDYKALISMKDSLQLTLSHYGIRHVDIL